MFVALLFVVLFGTTLGQNMSKILYEDENHVEVFTETELTRNGDNGTTIIVTIQTTRKPPSPANKNPFLVNSKKNFKLTEINRTTTLDTSATDSSLTKKVPVFRAPPALKKIHDYLIVVLLVAVMFAMGCSITWAQVRKIIIIKLTN